MWYYTYGHGAEQGKGLRNPVPAAGNSGMDTVEIDGRRFLLCDREECEWNLRYISGSERSRLCGFGPLAFSVKERMPQGCPHVTELSTLISRELLERGIKGMADMS
jgi:hypothetical protein